MDLSWSDAGFRPNKLYQFLKNFDVKKEATLVNGQAILLDKEILAMIFRLPEGPHKVEL